MRLFKRLLLLILLLSFMTGSVVAQTTLLQYTYQIVMSNQTSTGTLSGNITLTGSTFHQLVWNVSGTVSTCSVQVDSSSDGSTWTSGGVIASQTCTSNGSIVSTSVVSNFVRINLTAISGAGATFNAVLDGFSQNPAGGGGAVGAGTFVQTNNGGTNTPFVTNQMKCFVYVPQSTVTTSHLTYQVLVLDNSANLYDLGIYSISGSSGTLLSHIGATAGTTFSPTTGIKTLNWLSSFTINANNRYALCMTGNASVANIAGQNVSLQVNGAVTSNLTTVGGVLNNTIGFGADSNPSSFSTFPMFLIW